MSYGEVNIQSDIYELLRKGVPKKRIVDIIATRMKFKYPDYSLTACKKVISDYLYKGKRIDWDYIDRHRVRRAYVPKRVLKKYVRDLEKYDLIHI